MSDAVSVALIGLAGIGVTNLFALVLAYLNLRKKMNGLIGMAEINRHIQKKLDTQSVELKDAYIENGKNQERDSLK